MKKSDGKKPKNPLKSRNLLYSSDQKVKQKWNYVGVKITHFGVTS